MSRRREKAEKAKLGERVDEQHGEEQSQRGSARQHYQNRTARRREHQQDTDRQAREQRHGDS